MRIVSLVPAATEALFDMGAGALIVGRSHACPVPADVPPIPAVTSPPEMDLADPMLLDAALNTTGLHGPFELDTGMLTNLEPSLVVAQSACPSCSIDPAAIASLGVQIGAGVVRFDPGRLEDVVSEIEHLSRAADHARGGLALVTHIRNRLDRLRDELAGIGRPRVALLEWTDPVYAPGRWVPDVISAAGGEPVIGEAGSRAVVTDLAGVAASRPDIVIIAECGRDLLTNQHRAEALVDTAAWASTMAGEPRVLAIDAATLTTRPGPGLCDAAEALAWAFHGLHPDSRPSRGRVAERRDGTWFDMGNQPGTAPRE